MIIDFHTHTFPDKIAKTSIAKLSGLGNIKAYGEATESDLIRKMDKSKIDISVSLNIATKVTQVETINRYCASNTNKRIIFFGTMHQDYENIEEEIDFLARNGIKGIKMHPEFQTFFPSDKKMFRLYQKLCEHNMVIVFHSGKEEFVKNDYNYSSPEQFSIIHKQFPDLKMVLAHFGGHSSFEECKKYIFGKNIFVDTSYELDGTNSFLIDELLNYHSENMIVYGSDYPWRDPCSYIELIKKHRLSPEIKSKILYENGAKLLGLSETL